MSLRRRIVVGTLVLLGAGLIVSAFLTYNSLKSFLNGQVDNQLTPALDDAYHYLASLEHPFGGLTQPEEIQLIRSVPGNTYVEYLDPTGQLELRQHHAPPGASFEPARDRCAAAA